MPTRLILLPAAVLLCACGVGTLRDSEVDTKPIAQDARTAPESDLMRADASVAADAARRVDAAPPNDAVASADATSAWEASLADAVAPPDTQVATQARYFSEDFEGDDWAARFKLINSANISREDGVAAHSGKYGVRIKVADAGHWGGAILFDHARRGQVGNFKEVWARYYIRFGPNWRREDWRMGKAGFRARSDETCKAPCLEMTDSHHQDETTGAIRGYAYFHRNVSDADLANKTFSYKSREWVAGSERERERWYCVETHHVLNTPGQGDGTYQNWLDGSLVVDATGIRQRDSATFDIDHSVLIAYIGGGWVADRDMSVYFDDWAVSDQRIGCL